MERLKDYEEKLKLFFYILIVYLLSYAIQRIVVTQVK